ncbi:class II aldolase/adducin family protein [Pseudomonas sp. D5002]|uniref:class II aldolase/adducin family protein n=1 Tax=Pseudomonas sp. D5002 TaxID=2738818 RepID=UPI0015A39CAA|nr:class II aldolase/adducin family protein [Pseudomonas sp. D5002]NWB09099.1 class II aldolase/adducin family protein [Pseudomonas sp. D5002]
MTEQASLKGTVSDAEWQTRVELAALYRITALQGWDDFLFTHISARIPGPDNHFLLNPVGLWFEEITASSLIRIDREGNILQGDYSINGAGFVIHSAIHEAREDARFVIHLHTDDGVALASHREGLLPLNQRSLSVIPRLAYHDYEGIAEDLDERERIATSLGEHSMLVLRNHGTLAVGPTAAEAWLRIYSLEKAASTQIKALSIGREGVLNAPLSAQATVREQIKRRPRALDPAIIWPAILRKVDRESPGYDV